jgi:CTP synthase
MAQGQQLEKRAADGDLGGTMRLGAYPHPLKQKARDCADLRQHRHFRAPPPPLRGQHRLSEQLEKAGLVFSGMSPDGLLPETIEYPAGPSLVHRRPVPSGAEVAAVRAASAVCLVHRSGY